MTLVWPSTLVVHSLSLMLHLSLMLYLLDALIVVHVYPCLLACRGCTCCKNGGLDSLEMQLFFFVTWTMSSLASIVAQQVAPFFWPGSFAQTCAFLGGKLGCKHDVKSS